MKKLYQMNVPTITLTNVRVHNLKNVSLSLTMGEFIVFTGVSGSGKSSLAFHTIFSEGQRRYGESLSVFLQQYFKNIKKPDADDIRGLSPTIAVEQSASFKNPRSTVGTVTEIYDYLRLLFATIAIPIDPSTGEAIQTDTKESLLAKLLSHFHEKNIAIFAPLLFPKEKQLHITLNQLLAQGFYKIRLQGNLKDTEDCLENFDQSIVSGEILIDRIKVTENKHNRVTESLFLALKIGKNSVIIHDIEEDKDYLFSISSADQTYIPMFTPQDFSFNHPLGMCTFCKGLGYEAASVKNSENEESLFIKKIGRTHKFRKKSIKEEDTDLPTTYQSSCKHCLGSRLKPWPAAAKINGNTIWDICQMTISNAHTFFKQLLQTHKIEEHLQEVLDAIIQRLNFLDYTGLGYLALDRPMPTLSGGEAQRVKLAAHLGSKLTGITYVLDEPSIGLHPRDTHKLLSALKLLQLQGNTIIVVEHDEDTIAAADTIVDFGPGAGTLGGNILYNGSLTNFLKSSNTLTACHLRKEISFNKKRPHKRDEGRGIHLKGVNHHNLKNIDLYFPEGLFIVVTGVSGSGKSSLINEVLYPHLSNRLLKTDYPAGQCEELIISSLIKKVIAIDQTPIGRTPRSNPATYIGVFDDIRQFFGELPQSKEAGFSPGRFSFNVREGCCQECLGMGMIRINMDFMEDCWLTCSGCNGKRFDTKTLNICYQRKNIHDVLEMTVTEAIKFFHKQPIIQRKLEALSRIGLDYLRLGQSATTLSGGEAQRIKLAKELLRPSKGDTFYILDEPTTGLHMHDVNSLLKVLLDLSDKGNTVTVIEHNSDVMCAADLIIDLGPEGADGGGLLTGYGTPEEVALIKSPTGKVLKHALSKKPLKPKKQALIHHNSIHEVTIKNITQNNLKNLTISFPKNALTVCSGPSGAGKSSFAIDTLFAEGQRRYATSFSTYLRRFLHKPEKPHLKEAHGLSPTIAIEQKAASTQTSSTVGTLSEIYDYLRILYTHAGVAHSPITGEPILDISPESLANKIVSDHSKKTILILAPVFPSHYSSFSNFILNMKKSGFLKMKINNDLLEIDELSSSHHHNKEFFLLIDRLTVSKESQGRIREAIAQSFSLSCDTVTIEIEKQHLFYKQGFYTEHTGVPFTPITPNLFSFNMPEGMCPSCRGRGSSCLPTLHLHDPDITSTSVATLLASLFTHKDEIQNYKQLLHHLHIEKEQTLNELSAKTLSCLLKGFSLSTKKGQPQKCLPGVETLCKQSIQSEISNHPAIVYKDVLCPECQGSRINPLARNVLLNNLSLPDLCRLPIDHALGFLKTIVIEGDDNKTVAEVMLRIKAKMRLLIDIGLEHLNLSRSSSTLSNGERHRIHLSKHMGTYLRNIIYILEEPSSGLHPQDINKVIHTLNFLKEIGNTIVLIDHNPFVLRHADKILDFGPGAGQQNGGFLIAEGSLKEIKNNPQSLTGAYLTKKKKLEKKPTLNSKTAEKIVIPNITQGFLKNFNITLPIGAITCIMGVSGSGKSTLMTKVIKPFVEKEILKKQSPFTHIVHVNPHLIHKNGRSDVGSYSTLSSYLRDFFECLPEAKSKGLKSSFFSRNHKNGMCSSCQGRGFILTEMVFLPDFKSTCTECLGNKLNPLSLSVSYNGKTFAEVMKITIQELTELFSFIPEVVHIGNILSSLNLHYLTLEQGIDTLSCGEAQRLKLAKDLIKRKGKKVLYLLDEPTMGLHSTDIDKLLKIFKILISEGHTIVYIEHHVELMKFSHHLIELGPKAGEDGGYLLFTGAPEKIIDNKQSLSAAYF